MVTLNLLFQLTGTTTTHFTNIVVPTRWLLSVNLISFILKTKALQIILKCLNQVQCDQMLE